MEWKRGHPHAVVGFYHSMQYFNIGPALVHSDSPSKTTDSGRNDIFLSAALTLVATNRYMAEGDFCEFRKDVDPDDRDHDNPRILEVHKFDSEVVVVETQVVCSGGCK